MTQQTSLMRARYSRWYALALMFAAVTIAGTVRTNSTGASPAQTGIDVSAMMTTIDMDRLPVHTVSDMI